MEFKRITTNLHGYLMSPVEEERGSIVVAVVENNTNLRIGISIHPDAGLPKNDLLAQVSRELLNNSHGVSGVFAIQNSRQTEMQPHALNESATCNAMHVTWNEAHGREALGQGLEIFFQELRHPVRH
jgi:hypothetical protein